MNKSNFVSGFIGHGQFFAKRDQLAFHEVAVFSGGILDRKTVLKGKYFLFDIKLHRMSLLPKFFVEVNGSEIAQIKKKLTFLKPKYVVEGLDWEVEGNFLAHDYSITENGNVIASIHKRWMSWGDSFELDISDGADEVAALAVILAIDAVMDASAAAAASSSSSSN